MPANIDPIFPATPYAVAGSLAAVTACTTRAPTATASLAAANIIELVPTSTNGLRIDRIQVRGCSSSITAPTAAQQVSIWMWDGTTAWIIDEFLITAVTPSTTTVGAFDLSHYYQNLVLPASFKLYMATTVTTTGSTTALQVTVFGGAY